MKNYAVLFALLAVVLWNGNIHAQTHTVQSVVASSEEPQNPAPNMIDNDMNTRWSGSGMGITAIMDLGSTKNFDQLRIAFLDSDIRWARFDLEVSDDGVVWASISATTFQSTVGTPFAEFEDFNFTNQYARYLRYVGQGNQQNDYSSIREIQIVNTTTNDDSGNPVDTQAPTAPSLSSTGHTDTTANLSWSGATDNIGVTGCRIFKDGVLEATLGNVTTHQVTGLAASTAYSFTVTALDAAGNESPDSNAISVTTDASSGGGIGSPVWSETGSTASYSGDVAIGTGTVPQGYRLAVEGHVRAREVRVDQDTWPDYVFKEGYDLPSLEEIQKHIKEKGHLPNIPSAEDVSTNGVELGEMDRLLLEKIEELTLYIIQSKHQYDLLQKEFILLQKDLKTLKSQQNNQNR